MAGQSFIIHQFGQKAIYNVNNNNPRHEMKNMRFNNKEACTSLHGQNASDKSFARLGSNML